MAFVNTGTQRSMSLSVTRTGNDNSTTIMSPTSDPAYPDFDGKHAFGTFAEITEDEMQKLSEEDFATRVNGWKAYLQATYAVSEPNMWDDISASFKYANGVVVRLYDAGGGAVKTTVKGYVNNGHTFSTKITDSYGNLRHQFDINPGSTESSDSWILDGVTLQSIIDNNLFKFLDNSTSYNHPALHLFAFVDINSIYPIPV